MKKQLVALTVLMLLLMASVSVSQATTLWQIGLSDGTSAEFSTNIGSFVTNYNYDFGIVVPSLPTKQTNEAPGYLFSGTPLPVSDSFVANSLNISFSTSIAYSELIVNYGRAGSEINSILLDGGVIAELVGPGEGIWNNVSLSLKDVGIGQHTLTLAYSGGGNENGNYLDYIGLENGTPAATNVPEPATFILIGSGLFGLGMIRRKFRK